MRSSAATLAALALALELGTSSLLAAAIRPDACLAAHRKDTSLDAACYSLQEGDYGASRQQELDDRVRRKPPERRPNRPRLLHEPAH